AFREETAEPATVGEIEREEIERRRLLLETGPEHRRTEEEDGDDAHPFALDRGELREDQHVREEHDAEQPHREAEDVRELSNLNRDDAEEYEERRGDDDRSDDPDDAPPLRALRWAHVFGCMPGLAQIALGQLELDHAECHEEPRAE